MFWGNQTGQNSALPEFLIKQGGSAEIRSYFSNALLLGRFHTRNKQTIVGGEVGNRTP
jgi:hypothetical protein